MVLLECIHNIFRYLDFAEKVALYGFIFLNELKGSELLKSSL